MFKHTYMNIQTLIEFLVLLFYNSFQVSII